MDKFKINNCDSNYVIKIKNEYKIKQNNQIAQDAYLTLINETKTAIKNIEFVIGNESEQQVLKNRIQQGDTSVFDNILGIVQRGGNNSHYRSYLALDEQSVIEIRISAHYETINTLIGKTNNKSQYLYQVVLKSTPLQQQDGIPIIDTRRIGNTKVLTKGIINNDSSVDEIKQVLMSIHDYLFFPDYSYDAEIENNKEKLNCNRKMNKNKIRLTESQLHNVIKESLNNFFAESFNPNAFNGGYDIQNSKR